MSSNKPNAPEQGQVIGELKRGDVSGDWERYARDSEVVLGMLNP